MMKQVEFIVVDLFSGAGGVSTGFEMADGFKVIAAINHDEMAIESHLANHPGAAHFVEDIRSIQMEKITVNGEFLFELKSKQDWVNRVPGILPKKIRGGESWIWVDKNGNVFEKGSDFMAAEEQQTYPCKVYRLSNVAGEK